MIKRAERELWRHWALNSFDEVALQAWILTGWGVLAGKKKSATRVLLDHEQIPGIPLLHHGELAEAPRIVSLSSKNPCRADVFVLLGRG